MLDSCLLVKLSLLRSIIHSSNVKRSLAFFSVKKKKSFYIFDCQKMTNRFISCRISYKVNGLIDVRMQCLPRWKLDSFGLGGSHTTTRQAKQEKRQTSHTQWNSTLLLDYLQSVTISSSASAALQEFTVF